MGRPYQRDLLAWLRADVDPDAPLESVPQLLAGLTEMALGVSLARAIDGLEEGRWVADDTIGYSRTSSGNEIDFSPVRVPTEEGSGLTIPIESKWVDDGWRREALVLEGRYGRGVMATKSILDLEHPSWAIPAPLVACLQAKPWAV